MRGDYYDLNEERTALVGPAAPARALRLGDPITVGVQSVDRRAAGSTSSRFRGAGEANEQARRPASGDVATNRQARFKYHLLETWEAGIVLQGSEVKSLRDGKANLKDSYAAGARRRGLAPHVSHRALRARGRARARPRAPAQAADAPQRDRAPDRQDRRRRA